MAKFLNLDPDWGIRSFRKTKNKNEKNIPYFPRKPDESVVYVMRQGGYYSVRKSKKQTKSFGTLPSFPKKPNNSVPYIMRPGGYFSVQKKKKKQE